MPFRDGGRSISGPINRARFLCEMGQGATGQHYFTPWRLSAGYGVRESAGRAICTTAVAPAVIAVPPIPASASKTRTGTPQRTNSIIDAKFCFW